MSISKDPALTSDITKEEFLLISLGESFIPACRALVSTIFLKTVCILFEKSTNSSIDIIPEGKSVLILKEIISFSFLFNLCKFIHYSDFLRLKLILSFNYVKFIFLFNL